jgi:hypothetical protein
MTTIANNTTGGEESSIAPGDLVEWTKEKGYSWMTVEAIEGEQAICTYRVLDHPLDGDVRPTALIPKQAYFPLKELRVQRGH